MNNRWCFRVAFPAFAVMLVWNFALAVRGDDPATVGGKQTEELRWKLKEGQHFKIELVQDMKQSFDTGAGAQEMPMNFTMAMSWTVDEAKENEFKITQVIDRIKLSMSLPGMGDVVYDSDSKEEPQGFAGQQFATSLKPLVGLKIVQTIDGRGHSIKCDIDSAALEGLASAGMGGQFANEDMLKNLIGQSACVLPEESVDKGKSWDDKFSVKNQMGTMVTTAKYTYDGNEQKDGKSLDKILVETNVAIEPAENATVEVEITKQDNKGTVYFDNEAGYVNSATMSQAMDMQVGTMGQDINVTTTGTVAFSMKPDDGSSNKDAEKEKSDDKSAGEPKEKEAGGEK